MKTKRAQTYNPKNTPKWNVKDLSFTFDLKRMKQTVNSEDAPNPNVESFDTFKQYLEK